MREIGTGLLALISFIAVEFATANSPITPQRQKLVECPMVSPSEFAERLSNISSRVLTVVTVFAPERPVQLSKNQVNALADDVDFLSLSADCLRYQIEEQTNRQLRVQSAMDWQ